MSDAVLALTQLRYDQKSFWRNPQYVFFTVVQPIIFLFIFVTVFGNKTTLVDAHLIKRSTYYLPAILTLAIMSATFFNLTISLTRLRESGILKRVRSTPLPPWNFHRRARRHVRRGDVPARLLLVAMGKIIYGVSVPTHTLASGVITLVLAAAAFSCIAFAITRSSPARMHRPDRQRDNAPAALHFRRLHPQQRNPGFDAPRRRSLPGRAPLQRAATRLLIR